MKKHKHTHRSLTKQSVPRHKDGNGLGLRKRVVWHKLIQEKLAAIREQAKRIISSALQGKSAIVPNSYDNIDSRSRIRPGRIESA